MASTRYERGRDAEYRACHELRALGYHADRTAGSHGEADVIAWNDQHSRYIQCKTYVTRAGDYREDILKLMDMTLPPFATAELWLRKIGARGWEFKRCIKATLGPDAVALLLPVIAQPA